MYREVKRFLQHTGKFLTTSIVKLAKIKKSFWWNLLEAKKCMLPPIKHLIELISLALNCSLQGRRCKHAQGGLDMGQHGLTHKLMGAVYWANRASYCLSLFFQRLSTAYPTMDLCLLLESANLFASVICLIQHETLTNLGQVPRDLVTSSGFHCTGLSQGVLMNSKDRAMIKQTISSERIEGSLPSKASYRFCWPWLK